jgi:hypothetical protein
MTPRPRLRFSNSRKHRNKPGEPRDAAQKVPKTVVDFLRTLPASVVRKTCGNIGHPSFWLEDGFRYRCLCGDHTYND